MKNKKSLDEFKAHKYCYQNKPKLTEKDQLCGCFYCESIFRSSEIVEFVDWMEKEDGTKGFALCPICGIDAVIGEYTGYPITKDFMKRMHKLWFE